MIELEYKYYEFIKKWEDLYELRLKLSIRNVPIMKSTMNTLWTFVFRFND
jgi:hypothetical protein